MRRHPFRPVERRVPARSHGECEGRIIGREDGDLERIANRPDTRGVELRGGERDNDRGRRDGNDERPHQSDAERIAFGQYGDAVLDGDRSLAAD